MFRLIVNNKNSLIIKPIINNSIISTTSRSSIKPTTSLSLYSQRNSYSTFNNNNNYLINKHQHHQQQQQNDKVNNNSNNNSILQSINHYNSNNNNNIFKKSILNKYTTVTATLNNSNSSNNNDNNNNNSSSSNNNDDWISKFPKAVQPYLRLSRVDKPIGVWLLLYPCYWSISLAAPAGSLPDIKTMMVFGIGAFIMRSAGCVINDMADYKFDSKVERTKTRPLASKQITHKQGLVFLGAQLLTSFALILSSLNYYTIFLCASSLPIVILYPFMKRFTYYPQFVLGLAFNWGALAGYSAIAGQCDWSIVAPLYLAGISWTMVYDTIYAHQDKKDDVLVGVKSTALKFAEKSRIILSAFSGLVISGMFLTGIAANMPWIYYLGTAAASTHLIWQLKTVDFNNPSSCLDKFISNKNFGLLYLFIIIISKLLQDEKEEEEKKRKDHHNDKLIEL